jgi:hypothetical protein
MMPILTMLLTLIVVGVVLWAVNEYIPMAPQVKRLLNVVVLVLLVVWLLKVFGVWGWLAKMTV